MAFLSVTAYLELGRDGQGNRIQGGQEPAHGVREFLDFSGGLRNSPAFDGPRYVRICADANCYVNIGVDAVASSSGDSLNLPANVVEYFAITKGSRVSVLGA